MKNIFIISFFLSISCTNESSPKNLVPDDFNFPQNQIKSGKTMVYLNKATNETSFINLFHKQTNDTTFLIQCVYSKNSISDSTSFIDRKPVAYYLNVQNDGELWKAEQLSNNTFLGDNGKMTEVFNFHCQKDTLYASSKAETWIVKDTLFNWQGKLLPTLVTKSIIETKSNFLMTPVGDHNFKMEVTNYFSKHIGCVRRIIIADWIKIPVLSDLIEIREMQH